MGVGQWTSLLLLHEFMTAPGKLDCALPTLHPKHSNTRGAIISTIPLGYAQDAMPELRLRRAAVPLCPSIGSEPLMRPLHRVALKLSMLGRRN